MYQVPARNLILIPYCFLRDRYFYLHFRDEETKVSPGTLWLQTIENGSGYCKQKGDLFDEGTKVSGSLGQKCSWVFRGLGLWSGVCWAPGSLSLPTVSVPFSCSLAWRVGWGSPRLPACSPFLRSQSRGQTSRLPLPPPASPCLPLLRSSQRST